MLRERKKTAGQQVRVSGSDRGGAERKGSRAGGRLGHLQKSSPAFLWFLKHVADWQKEKGPFAGLSAQMSPEATCLFGILPFILLPKFPHVSSSQCLLRGGGMAGLHSVPSARSGEGTPEVTTSKLSSVLADNKKLLVEWVNCTLFIQLNTIQNLFFMIL